MTLPWRNRLILWTLLLMGSSIEGYSKGDHLQWLDAYNVCWTSQSKDASESMPCGGGDIGLNVWVENNELLFYISRSGVFDENNVFPKLGRVRIDLSPNPFIHASFSQKLILKDGCIEITAIKDNQKTTIKLWVDVFKPVINVDVTSNQKLSMKASYENWRYRPLTWETPGQIRSSLAYRDAPVKAVIQPDTIRWSGEGVLWYHRNREKTVFDMTVEQQHLSSVQSQLWNPLKDLTFGGYMEGKGFVKEKITMGRYIDTDYKGYCLVSEKSSEHQSLNIVLCTAQTKDIGQWVDSLQRTITAFRHSSEQEHQRTIAWWHTFWDRSHVVINPDSASATTPSWQVGRNYQLFRYQQACNAYGKLPTKFNGGLFTFDPSLVGKQFPYTPDHRDWGGGTHTAQNQRLVYWPMLKNGDTDMMKSELDFYKNALVNAEARVRQYWNHRGACFTEQIEWFGLPMAGSYGWHRPALLDTGIQDNLWVDYEWDTALEFCKMAIDIYRYTGKDIHEYLPLIKECLTFYDEHYQYLAKKRSTRPLDGKGKLVLYPGTACETYKMAYNSSCTIAALKSLTQGLLSLPADYLTTDERTYFSSFMNRIPDIPMRTMNGHQTIAPAETWNCINNIEIPQLYPIFPWRLYGIGKPHLDIAINTWKYGLDNENQRGYISWHQDAIFCACMGLTSEAKAITLKKMTDSSRRYPTFWGPGHDWVPDHNWGGSGMIGVQEMLVQESDSKIYLFPAWPKEWDVDFKLNLPNNTIIECTLKRGKIQKLIVTPEKYKKDVVIM
jgi:hypothetical protein